jgi:hypothetical protein
VRFRRACRGHVESRLVSWEISANLGRHARTAVDARGWHLEITRGNQVARIVIEISGTAWSSDPLSLPEDTRRALETDGRTELLKVLEHDDPPCVIHCGSNGCVYSSAGCLAEREHVGLDTRREERDLERAVGDRSSLPNQLIEPRLDQRSVALFVDVQSVVGSGRSSVDEDAERHEGPWRPRSHHEMNPSCPTSPSKC